MWNLRSQMILRLKELSENEVKCFVDIYSIHPFFFYSKFSTPLTIFHFLTDSSQIKVPAKPLHHNFKEKDVQKSQIWKQMAVLIHLQPKNSKKKKSC